MSTKYTSARSARKSAKKVKRNFIITLIIVTLLIYFSFTWVLPSFINGIGFIEGIIKPSKKIQPQLNENITLAPPVLNIAYEATNTANIDIKGYGSPNSKVKLFLDDIPGQSINVGDNGSFTFENVSLNLGTNNIYAKTLDEKNNESLPSKTIKIFFDNEKPRLTVNEPEDNKNIQGGDKKIKVSGKTDPGVQVLINGNQVIVNGDGKFSSDQPLNEGDNTFSIRAVDTASNYIEMERKVTYKP